MHILYNTYMCCNYLECAYSCQDEIYIWRVLQIFFLGGDEKIIERCR